MTSDTLARLQQVFQTTFGVEPLSVTEHTSKDDIKEWDSLGHLRLMMAVEKEFGVKFTTAEIIHMSDFGAIYLSLQKSVHTP